MILLYLLGLILGFAICYFVATQIWLPLVHNTRIFPMFRRVELSDDVYNLQDTVLLMQEKAIAMEALANLLEKQAGLLAEIERHRSKIENLEVLEKSKQPPSEE